MSQLILFTYVLALIIGFISIGTIGIIALWIKKRTLYIIFLLYSAYTIDMLAEIVHRYLFVNLPGLWVNLSIVWNPVMIFTRFFLLFSILMFSHYFTFKGCKNKYVISYSIFTILCFLVNIIIYFKSGMTENLMVTVPDYIYFTLIYLTLLLGIIYIIRSKQTELEFMNRLEYSFLKKITVLFTISTPLIFNDDCSFIKTPFRFAPLIYTLFSIILCLHIYNIYLVSGNLKEVNDSLESSLFQKYNISAREKEIILLISKGYSNKQISEKLFISLSTVKSHIYNIYKKMGFKTRFQLMNTFNSV